MLLKELFSKNIYNEIKVTDKQDALLNEEDLNVAQEFNRLDLIAIKEKEKLSRGESSNFDPVKVL